MLKQCIVTEQDSLGQVYFSLWTLASLLRLFGERRIAHSCVAGGLQRYIYTGSAGGLVLLHMAGLAGSYLSCTGSCLALDLGGKAVIGSGRLIECSGSRWLLCAVQGIET